MGKNKKLKISSVKSNFGKLSPYQVKFEHGEVDAEAFQNWKAKFKICTHKNDENVKENAEDMRGPEVKLRIKSDFATYYSTAKSLSGNGSKQDPYYSYYIGLRNKESGTMTMYQFDQITVGANIKAPPTKNAVLLQAQSDEKQNELKAKQAAKKHLVQEFGMNKGRRIYEQADRMQVEAETLEKKLSKAAESVNPDNLFLPGLDDEMPEINFAANLTPPCNRDAIRIEDAYRISDILTEEECQQLVESARQISEEYSTKDQIENGLGKRAFTEILAHTLRQNSEFGNEDMLAVAIYMEGIVQFLNLKSSKFQVGPKVLPNFVPYPLKNKIWDVFTDQGRISPESKDRAACYVMILGLMINNYNLDFSLLSNTIKSVKVDTMKKLVNVIGGSFHVDPRTKRGFVNLKLPLTVYDPNKVFRRRK